MPKDMSGDLVLDMACGLGELGRLMSRRGATVTAVDVSPAMLAHAIEQEEREPLGIRHLVGDLTDAHWWDGVPFDGAACNMALMDIDDLDAALATASRVLKPGGWFSFSLLHPCFPGFRDATSEQLSSWPPDRGYAAEGWWTTGGDGVRGRVGAHHRMLSTYLNATLRAGFVLDEFVEPVTPTGQPTTAAQQVPRFLVVGCHLGT
jgi:SAM-dependent methyltransferase